MSSRSGYAVRVSTPSTAAASRSGLVARGNDDRHARRRGRKRQPQPPRARRQRLVLGRYAVPLEMPVRRTRCLRPAARSMGAMDQHPRQMGDRVRRRALGDPPEQVPFRERDACREGAGDRVAAREGGAHEVGLLREQERIPARLEIRMGARAVGEKLVMVDVGEHRCRRRESSSASSASASGATMSPALKTPS